MFTRRSGVKSVALVGFLNPELLELAKRTVAEIPQDSPMRSKSFVRALGVAKQIYRRKLRSESNPNRYALGHALVTFINFVEHELLGGYKGSSTKLLAPRAEDKISTFLGEAWQRLAAADNPQKELERLKEEFQALSGEL